MSEKQWNVEAFGIRTGRDWFKVIPNPVIFNLRQLDSQLKLFVPSLFSKIEVTKFGVYVEVPYQVSSKLVKYLQDHCCLGVPVRVTGV